MTRKDENLAPYLTKTKYLDGQTGQAEQHKRQEFIDALKVLDECDVWDGVAECWRIGTVTNITSDRISVETMSSATTLHVSRHAHCVVPIWTAARREREDYVFMESKGPSVSRGNDDENDDVDHGTPSGYRNNYDAGSDDGDDADDNLHDDKDAQPAKKDGDGDVHKDISNAKDDDDDDGMIFFFVNFIYFISLDV